MLKTKIDLGYIEPVSHSRNHVHVPYADYDLQIGSMKCRPGFWTQEKEVYHPDRKWGALHLMAYHALQDRGFVTFRTP